MISLIVIDLKTPTGNKSIPKGLIQGLLKRGYHSISTDSLTSRETGLLNGYRNRESREKLNDLLIQVYMDILNSREHNIDYNTGLTELSAGIYSLCEKEQLASIVNKAQWQYHIESIVIRTGLSEEK